MLASSPPPSAVRRSPEQLSMERLQRYTGILLEGMAQHALEFEPGGSEDYRRSLIDCQRHILAATAIEQIPSILESAVAHYANYGRKMQRAVEEVTRQRNAILLLLQRELLSRGLTPVLEESLRELETSLNAATTPEALRRMRQNLESALQAQAPQPPSDSAEAAVRFQWKTAESPTGLPGPDQARSFLEESFGRTERSYAVLLRFSLLSTVEQRYGGGAAIDYLNASTQYVMRCLRPGDRLYHWTSDVLLAVFQRDLSPAGVLIEIKRLVAGSPEQVVEVDGRRIMIGCPIAFDMNPFWRFPSLEQLLATFDAFTRRRT